MGNLQPVLAVIPARGGSKGLPGKNVRPFAGLPLIAHSIALSKLCPEIARCIISTDSPEITEVARQHGGEVPFLRPAELAQDDTPMWPVLQHAVREMERVSGMRYGSVLLLDPTSPGRIPSDITEAVRLLDEDPAAVGVIAVSEPHFNPRWVCVENAGGYIRHVVPMDKKYTRRQDVPPVYRINALLYLWRREYMEQKSQGVGEHPHRMLVVPEERAIHIDEASDFTLAELLIREGLVTLPWLSSGE